LKSHEETERSYIQCGPFFRQQKSLKHLPREKLESAIAAWFKQTCESDASMDGTHLKEKALHIDAHLGIANFRASSGWINRFNRKHNIVYRTVR
jgi:centromere protein B